MADELDDVIEAVAAGPASATSGERSATAQRLPDLIEADKYLGAKAAVNSAGSAWGCLRPARVVPPGAVGPSERE